MRSIPPISTRAQSAFTLIEAIITVAIVGVVIAFLFSALGQARRKSAGPKCVQQLRQLAAAGLQFATENGGRLPYRGDWAHPTNPTCSILPYLGIPLRPSGSSSRLERTALTCIAAQHGKTKTEQEFFRTYSINQYATGAEAGGASTVATWESQVAARRSPQRISQVKRPAQQAFFMDGTGLYDTGNFDPPTYRYSAFQAPDRLNPQGDTYVNSWRTPYVHDGRIYVAYLDGHVAPLSLEEAQNGIIGPTNSVGSTRTHPFWGAEL